MTQLQTAFGLMSGTSADGVDAALIRTDGKDSFQFVGAITLPYEDSFSHRLLATASSDVSLLEVLRLEQALTLRHVEACRTLLDAYPAQEDQPAVIGFHGHTVRHVSSEGLTWQLGNPSLLAEQLGIPVVSDFRRRDMAAGGQGAPLAALLHQHLMAHVPKPTAVLNVGGVANVTWLGQDGQVIAGDTGPGCGLLDAWIRRHTGRSFDCHGEVAKAGSVDHGLVAATLRDAYFQRPFPKSADRFDFAVDRLDRLSTPDGAATLCAITVAAVVGALHTFPALPETLWVTGGGTHHPVIMGGLRQHLARVLPIEAAHLRSAYLEAECFAWLAVRRLRGLPTSWPTSTGANRGTVGGLLTS